MEDPLAVLIEGLVVLPRDVISHFVSGMHSVCMIRENEVAGRYKRFQERVENFIRICRIPIEYKRSMFDDINVPTDQTSVWLNVTNRKKLIFRRESLCREVLPKKFDKLITDTMNMKCCKTGQSIMEDPTICLICGDVICSRSCKECCVDGVGPVTRHVINKHKGCGIVLRVSSSEILLFRGEFCAYYPSLYVDAYGEEDRGLRRGKPLFLSQERFEALNKLHQMKGVAQAVSRIRLHADRVYRNNVF